MKKFMDKDFLLSNETAKKLYFNHAAKMPIIDYHCHINPAEIAQNRKFDNITQVWLGGDHYKWRLIRSCGVDEKYITGNESTDREKFQAFAESLPKAIGNPLYHWTHLELKRYFGYDGILNSETAEEVWNLCNEKLRHDDMSVRGLIGRSNVRAIATTDDPADSLEWHKKIKEDSSFRVKVVPAWRPDRIMSIEKPGFAEYTKKLEQASGVSIHGIDDVRDALNARLDFFDGMGCRASDHGLDSVMYAPATDGELDAILKKGLAGNPLTGGEIEKYKYAVLLFLGRQYAKRGWVMEIHYGALRGVNSRMLRRLGPDTGYDGIATRFCAEGIVRFLNELDRTGELPKTILYPLNANDNDVVNAAAGCFSGTTPGKVQAGAAWWFNDTKAGMIEQMTSFANIGVLGTFAGMLTDSRSFLSYTRHEYFRRILCDLIGTWVENGEYPDDEKALGQIVEDICFNNTNRFFGFGC
jgi:glucuronate isomerase